LTQTLLSKRLKFSYDEPTSSNYATLETRNLHPVLDFDDTTSESAVFGGTLPRNYAGGGVTVTLHMAATSATTNAVVFSSAFERIGNAQQDIDSDGFATANNSSSTTTNGTSGNVIPIAITHTDGAQMDSMAVGEGYRLKIALLPADAGDTMAGDAEIRFVEVKET
jgi:hypothetical protein